MAIIEWIDRSGGAVSAVEAGLVQAEIEDSAYRQAQEIGEGTAVVVGVNRFAGNQESEIPVPAADPEVERRQIERLVEFRSGRDQAQVDAALEEVHRVAFGSGNLLYPMKAALECGATTGEVSGVLVGVFGRYRPRT